MTDEGGEPVAVTGVKHMEVCPGSHYPDRDWGGRTELLDPLIDVLSGFEESNGRANAAKALGWIGDERALEPLCTAIVEDPEPDVRAAAAGGLRSLGSERAVPTLRTVAAEDDDGDVRWRAGRALAVIGWNDRDREAERLVRTGDERAWEGFRTELGRDYVDGQAPIRARLQRLLGSVEGESLGRVLAGLGSFEGAVEDVTPFLDHEDPAVRRGAVEGVRDHDGAPLDRLAALGRSDPDRAVRTAAVDALGVGLHHSGDATERLRPFLDDEVPDVRAAAADHLRFADPPGNVSVLFECLDDPDPSVRDRAAWSLKVAGFPGAVPELLSAFPDDDPTVSKHLLVALQWCSGPSGTAEASDFELLASERVPTPDGTGSRPYDPGRAREVLEAGLYDEDPEVAYEAAHTLQSTRHPDAAAALVAVVDDESAPSENAARAARFLGEFRDSDRAREGHRRALAHPAAAVRRAAVDRAGRFSDAEEVAILLDALDDEAPEVRAAAADRARYHDDDRLVRALEARLETETDGTASYRLKKTLGTFDR